MLRAALLGMMLLGLGGQAVAEGLPPDRLGILYKLRDASSMRVAQYYAAHRHVPAANLIGLDLPDRPTISRQELEQLRSVMLDKLPSGVESLLLVWSRPFAVECMSVTTAFAAGYLAAFCEPGCRNTLRSPLFDTPGWLPADTVGWLPAMLLPSADEALAERVIERGIEGDDTQPPGTVYLVRTGDAARNVRAAGYEYAEASVSHQLIVRELETPVERPPVDTIAYFTGVGRVEELHRISFRPGAAADHLTSTGGVLEGGTQMSALEWLRQGATGSYGSVSEPCNRPAKFPDPAVFLKFYLRGESLLEAYWKSVAMPGQGLFIGEPLSQPFSRHSVVAR